MNETREKLEVVLRAAALITEVPWSNGDWTSIDSLASGEVDLVAQSYESLHDPTLFRTVMELVHADVNFVQGKTGSGSEGCQLFRLFGAFEMFACKGIAPFKNRSVRFVEPKAEVDFSAVPQELSFLCPIAEEILQFESGHAPALEIDTKRLRVVADRIKNQNLYNGIFIPWAKANANLKSAEVLYGFFGYLDGHGYQLT